MTDERDEIRVDSPARRAGAITEDERALLEALRRKGVNAGRLHTKIHSLDAALDQVAWLDDEDLRALQPPEADALNSRASPHVSIDPQRMSGAVCFKGTRLPVGHLLENLQHGATVTEFAEWFAADPEQIRAVLQWIIDGLEAARDTSLERRHPGPPQEAEQ